MTPLRSVAGLVLAATMLLVLPSTGTARGHGRDRADDGPTIYGHRGASGYRPEHTLGSYRLAARMGADYIEPDLVSTKDHVLVVRHEPAIGGTTDVADHPEFADRRTTKVIDGVPFTGEWFTEDFTLAELRTLRAKERLPAQRQRNTIYDGRYQVPTFQEVIDLRDLLSRKLHRRIGIIPELKHSTYFRSLGLPLEEPFARTLRRNGIANRRGKVTAQSFEIGNLKVLDKLLPGVPLVQLLDATRQAARRRAGRGRHDHLRRHGDARRGCAAIARYADIAGPSKGYIVPRDPNTGASLAPTTFVQDAHAAGLDVVPYTFRNENQYLPLELRSSADLDAYGNAIAEFQQFFDLGVDGLFTDNPDTAIAARDGE